MIKQIATLTQIIYLILLNAFGKGTTGINKRISLKCIKDPEDNLTETTI